MMRILCSFLNIPKQIPLFGVYFDIMPNYVKVSEYAEIKGVHKKTIYRWIKSDGINAKEIDGVWHVDADDNLNNISGIDSTIATLTQQNSYLQQTTDDLKTQLSQAHEIIKEMQQDRQRSDTIIMKLTLQLEQQTQLLEDMRHRSLWSKVRTVLGFASQ